MDKHVILKADDETLHELIEKHKHLAVLETKRLKAENLKGSYEGTEIPPERLRYLGELFTAAEDTQQVKEFFVKAAIEFEEQSDDSYFYGYSESADMWRKAGEEQKAIDLYQRAGNLAEQNDQTAMALEFYSQAGDETKVRALLGTQDSTYREY